MRLAEDSSLTELAQDYGLTLKRAPGLSGLGTLVADAGEPLVDIEAELRADPRVASLSPAGALYGASAGLPTASVARALEWHLSASGAPARQDYDLSGYVVAVLDTGLALAEDGERSALPSLSGVAIRSPYDFVEGDEQPQDENFHGSLVSSILASDGEVQGVAAGVTLMPLRVLDERGEGSEADLVDAILYAVDEGADVICMSLTFGEGYAPSDDLAEALATAWESGVVLVSAAGNDGRLGLPYPAASPYVISVGATELDPDLGQRMAAYSNRSQALDVSAPGGSLQHDYDQDGYVDGVLSEGIDPQDPARVSTWLSAGTSQATAIVAGAAVHLLAAGAEGPAGVRLALQASQRPLDDRTSRLVAEHGGALDISAAISAIESGSADPSPMLSARILPDEAEPPGEVWAKAAGLVGDPLELRGGSLSGRVGGLTANAGRFHGQLGQGGQAQRGARARD